MSKPRVTETDRLADVIEVVELGRRTGLLMVERGGADLLEEGAIYFYAGRATYAAVERVRGQDALSVLGGWGACRFSFDPAADPPAPNIGARPAPSASGQMATPPGYYNTHGAPPQRQAPQSPANPPSWYTPSSQPPVTGPRGVSQPGSGVSWPSQGSNPLGFPAGPGGPATNPSGVFNPAVTSGSLPLPQGWPQSDAPITGTAGAAPNGATPNAARGTGETPTSQRQPARAEAALLRRPRRAPNAQNLMAVIQNYGLSRAHRTLLMLADGEHNVIDIARLSSKQIDEVQALLGDLEGHGLIYYY